MTKGVSLKMHRHSTNRRAKALQPFVLLVGLASVFTASTLAQQVPNPDDRPGSIAATVMDPNDDTVPNAAIVLQGGESSDRHTTVANENGFFEIRNVRSGIPYRVTVHANGFTDWTSPPIVLQPNQYKLLTDCRLRLQDVQTTINVGYSSVQVAKQQVATEEKQRVLGIIPNFYVVYDRNPEPLTPRLKFELAMKVSTDPVTALGIGFVAGIRQAADSPDFQLGAKGYGQRYGVTAANGFTDILIGGAILPSLLHQDPRYFYQGTGTKKSRILHAISNPFICRGDNGQMQPNYSSLGGDLISAGMSNAYYPQSNRGPGLVFGNFAIGTAERAISSLAQEFLFRRITTKTGK